MSLSSILTPDVQASIFSNGYEDEFVELLRTMLPKMQTFDSVEQWERYADDVRRQVLELFSRGHPDGLLEESPRVVWHDTIHTDYGYDIRKLAYEAFPGMWIPALLYIPESISGPAPVVLNPNGHHAGGVAMAYKQARCINLAKRGIIALNTEFVGMGQLAGSIPHTRLAYLDAYGVSGAGLFYSAVKRGLDVLLDVDEADHDRVGVTGLSGGGWQTLMLSALDARVTVSIPVAGHSPVWQRIENVSDIGDNEQMPPDLCTIADYDTLTSMIAPRPLLLIYNRYDDCCFQSERTRASVYETTCPIYELYGASDRIDFHENLDPGTHNYESDSRAQLYRFLDSHFGLETHEGDLPYESELMTESALSVELPASNATILSIAIDLSAKRHAQPQTPVSESIRQLRIPDARAKEFETFGRIARKEQFVERGVLRMRGSIDIPAIRLESDPKLRSEDMIAGLVLNDSGRSQGEASIPQAARSWHTAIFADVFGTGERYVNPRFEMVFNASGNRTLGVQIAQISALLEWIAGDASAVSVCASGRCVSVAALIAVYLMPGVRVARLELAQLPRSFSDLIHQAVSYDESPAIFCPGLFAGADIEDILAECDVAVFDPVRGPLTRRALETAADAT